MMKVREFIELLRHFDPDLPCSVDVWNDYYLRAWLSEDGKKLNVTSLCGHNENNRYYHRAVFIPKPDGPISLIQEFEHLRARTEEESAADLAAGAINEREHIEDIARIRQKAADIKAAHERRERAEFERLKALFG